MGYFDEIEKMLETGRAHISGRSDGNLLSELTGGVEYWVIERHDTGSTIHVPIADRPEWTRFEKE